MLSYEKAARNQALFREINERIDSLAPPGSTVVVCECLDVGCVETIELSSADYEAVRSVGHRFLMKPGHEDLSVERIVARHDGYVVAEKIGRGKAVAESLDPRA